MKRIILFTILICSMLAPTRAGIDPLYSQFMTNPFLINPALTGTYPYYQIILNNRLQWVGFEDAPITNTLSMYGPMKTQPMGVGAYIMHDVAGAESKTNFNGTYAYNYGLAEDLKISMGLMLGLMSYKLDGSRLKIKNEDDPVFTQGETYSQIKPDASVGAYVYSSIYHGGFAVTNLFGNKIQFDTDTVETSNESRLRPHFYLHGGYKYYVNRELAIEPAFVLKKVPSNQFQLDLNVRAWYGNRSWNGTKVWGGLSYRSGDAISILMGIIYQKKIEFGYSYDLGINKFRKPAGHSGTHEFMIGFKFNNFQQL